MEDYISYMLWPFWNMLWCPFNLQIHMPSFNTSWMIFLWIPRWFCGLLNWWHPHFLQKPERAWTTCFTCFGQAQGSWTLYQIGEMWISSNQSGIPWLHHLWKWHLHGFLQGLDHCWLGYPNFYLWCSMFSWICQLLSMFHCTLF